MPQVERDDGERHVEGRSGGLGDDPFVVEEAVACRMQVRVVDDDRGGERGRLRARQLVGKREDRQEAQRAPGPECVPEPVVRREIGQHGRSVGRRPAVLRRGPEDAVLSEGERALVACGGQRGGDARAVCRPHPPERLRDGQVVCDLDSRPVRGRHCLRRVEPWDCRDAPDAALQDQLCVDRAPGPDERDRVETFEHVSEPG